MRQTILLGIYFIIGILLSSSASAQELYKCVTSQGTSYQSRPCAITANQKKACNGSASTEFNGNCRLFEHQQQQAIVQERNAYTQDLVINKTQIPPQKRHELQRDVMAFHECKRHIMSQERLAKYANKNSQLLENNARFYAAKICTEEGSVYLSCNAATNTLLTQTSQNCPLKRKNIR